MTMCIPPAPSAPPTSVNVSDVTPSSITVQWGPVDCIHRNGDITGYSVQYGNVESNWRYGFYVTKRHSTVTQSIIPFNEYIYMLFLWRQSMVLVLENIMR